MTAIALPKSPNNVGIGLAGLILGLMWFGLRVPFPTASIPVEQSATEAPSAPSADPCDGFATLYYVRDGATGAADGSNWTDAYDDLPTTLDRNACYYVADGNYAGYTYNDALSGTQLIVIGKASDTFHGTDTGWLSTYGDGQASFAGLFDCNTSGYLVFDGAYRNESDWSDPTGYGFNIDGTQTISDLSGTDRVCDNVTIKYSDIGPDDGTTDSSGYGDILYFGGFDRLAEAWTFQYNYVHNGRALCQHAGVHNILYEYNYMAKNWQKTGCRGQGRASSVVFRWNIMRDMCQGTDFEEGTNEGNCTAILGWYGNAGSNNEDYSSSKVYGNLIMDVSPSSPITYSDGVIFMGDDRTGQGGGPQNCDECDIYQNTLVGMDAGQIGFTYTGTKTNTNAENNIWYNIGAATPFCQAVTCSNNPKITSDIFVNAAAENYRLTSDGAAGVGGTLASPYDVDMDGVTRGQGDWDIGAFEYVP